MIKKKVQIVLYYRDANKQIHFLLLRTNKRRNSFWQNITGGVENAESYQEAALRESAEETGIEKSNIKELRETNMEFEFFDQWQRDVREKVFALECNEIFPVKLDPQEHEDFKWVSKDEIGRDSVKYESNWLALLSQKEALEIL